MSHDRALNQRLLEKAAKVSKLYFQGPWPSFQDGEPNGLHARPDDCPGGYCWNPLHNNSQLFELAVNAGFTINFSTGNVYGPPESRVHVCTKVTNKPLAWCIVKAAADLADERHL